MNLLTKAQTLERGADERNDETAMSGERKVTLLIQLICFLLINAKNYWIQMCDKNYSTFIK